MKTASFFTFAGAGRVSIARFAPRTAPAGFKIFKPLAPGPWFNSVNEAMYRRLYSAQLDQLDPQATWDALHKLVPDGVEPVLLCYEDPHAIARGETFCHRHMAAQWIRDRLGHEVAELV